MARREIKSEGKDVASAIIHGLNELGRRRDQVEVTVIQEEKSGFLGIGGRHAIVQLVEKKWDSEHSTPMKPKAPAKAAAAASSSSSSFKPKSAGGRKRRDDAKKPSRSRTRTERPERSLAPKMPKENEPQKLPSTEIQNAVIPDNIKEPMNQARESLEKILGFMGIKVENLNVWWDAKQQRVLLTFDCDHPAVVIGKEGKTLESIQYIITLIVSRHFDNPISVMSDTQNYWRKLEDKINNEIEKAVSMLKRTKRSYRFRPMSAQMRRYIHRFLADNADVSTVSEGEGKWRKIVLKLQGKTEALESAAAEAAFEEIPSCEDDCCNCGPIVEGEVENAPVAPCVDEAPVADAPVAAEAKPEAEPCVVSEDNSKCNCVLTAETATCTCVATNEGTCEDKSICADAAQPVREVPVTTEAQVATEVPVTLEAPVTTEAEVVSETVVSTEEAACVVSHDNAKCGCVLTDETTSCTCVATTEGTCAEVAVEPTEHKEENK